MPQLLLENVEVDKNCTYKNASVIIRKCGSKQKLYL